MKRFVICLTLVGLFALPAMAQTAVHVPAADVVVTDNTRHLEPYVYLENTYRNNAGWLSWYPYAGLEFVDDIGTIFAYDPLAPPPMTSKEQVWGTGMQPPIPPAPPGPDPGFLMTGFDVGWYSLDTNTTHVQVLTVNFYDNPYHPNAPNSSGGDYTGYSVGTVWVAVPPTLLQSYVVTAPNFAGANFFDWDFDQDLGLPDVQMPADLWMGVAVGLADTGVMLAKDWSGPNPWYFYNGGAEYGHSDWWWAAGWNWKQYFNGPPLPTSGAPYFDPYSPRGSFTYSIRGVPEPATLALLALSGLAMIRRRR